MFEEIVFFQELRPMQIEKANIETRLITFLEKHANRFSYFEKC